MLLIVSYRLMLMIQTIHHKSEMVVAVLVGVTSFATRNLSIAVIVGILAEFVVDYYKKHVVLLDRSNA
jgi:hypothetical protein